MNIRKYALLLAAMLGATVVLAGCVDNTPADNSNGENSNDVNSEIGDTILDDELYFDDFDEVEVVEEDVYGKDLENVERYPDSVRSYYESYDGEVSLTYQTADDQEEVRTYFDEQLTGDGWALEGESSEYMEYVREGDGGEEYMSVYLYEYSDQGVTEYELLYEPPYDESEELDEEGDFEIEL